MTESSPRPPVTVALLVVPEATASALYGMLDVLASAGRDWAMLTTGQAGAPLFAPSLVAQDTAGFRGPNGAWIQPDGPLPDPAAVEIVIVPELAINPNLPAASAHEAEGAWLRACRDAGAMVCSVCSGSMLLAESGILAGAEATTHWAFTDALRRRYPDITVRADRVLVASGPGHRIVTAGGAASWSDLLLYLTGRLFGADQAVRLAKIHLLQWHVAGQLPFASLTLATQHDDAVIAACQEWLADHYREPNPVTALVARSGLPERTFKRRFARATGFAPIQYVQNLRVEEAKQLLETTADPVEDVACAVGYDDGTFFRGLFRRMVGETPAAYRRRFQAPHLTRTYPLRTMS